MNVIIDTIFHYGWLAVLLVIFAESGLLVGFFLPGDSLLFLTGTLIAQGVIGIPVFALLPLLFIAAALGNTTGYFLGRRLGRSFYLKHTGKFLKKRYLDDADAFYAQYGSRTMLIVMFIPIVRAFAAFAAGVARMEYRTFITYNLIGVGLWVSSFLLLGYYAGQQIERLGINIEVATLLIIALSFLPAVVHFLSSKKNRKRITTYLTSLRKTK